MKNLAIKLLLKAWLPALIWMVLIFLGSSLLAASVSESRAVDFVAHKLVHLFEYSVLFVLIYRAVKGFGRGLFKLTAVVGKLNTLVSFALTVGYAVTDEIHQSFVPGRDARASDVLVDTLAALLGWLVIRYFRNFHGSFKSTAVVGKLKDIFPLLLFLLGCGLLRGYPCPGLCPKIIPAQAANIPSFAVPDGYELKEGEIDHLSATIELYSTQGVAINFRPDFDFGLAGFATFVYSNEKYYGQLDPSVFTLAVYEGVMARAKLDECWVCKAWPSETTIVEGSLRTGLNYQLFFGFEPREVKSGQNYTAILTTTEPVRGRYRFWLRNLYYDGYALTFDPTTQTFSHPSAASVAAPFGLFVREGWQGTPPRFHPVILIHGMGGRPTDWSLPEQDYVSLLREMYARDGDFDYPASWIHTYHYGNVNGEYNYQGDIREIAEGLEDVVNDLATRYAESFGETLEGLESRDEDRVVDIVGYSMGGLVGRWYLVRHQDNHHIRKLVTIATPHEGIYWLGRKEGVGTLPRVGPELEEAISDVADMVIDALDKSGQSISVESEAALEMVPNSEFYHFLNLVEWTPVDVQYYTIYGDIDINLKQKVFFFTLEKKVALGDVLIFSESASTIPAVTPERFGYNEDWTFPVGMAISPDGVSAKFYLESLDITNFRFWHLGILHQPEIKDKTIEILSGEI
jgi:pimeloyl-ACP methyl ester carboxylesterase